MGERRWWRYVVGNDFLVSKSDAEVLREILLDENGEPRDGVEKMVGWGEDDWVYVIPAEMLEADDE